MGRSRPRRVSAFSVGLDDTREDQASNHHS